MHKRQLAFYQVHSLTIIVFAVFHMRVLHISAGKLYGGVESLQVTAARYRNIGGEVRAGAALKNS
jgi:hypothetical protein